MFRVEQRTVSESVRGLWDSEILPNLSELVTIPALSPNFDPDWAASGHLDAAIEHVKSWLAARDIPGAQLDVIRLDGEHGPRSPLLMLDVPATPGAEDQGTALLYGHLDKQPPVANWSEGLGPWTPVRRGERLYGRGSADDGYAGYAAVAALETVRASGGAHARTVLLLETGEESGSPDLPAYLEHLKQRLGRVSFVVCLDSGGSDYERLWLTTSLRGLAQVRLTVRVLESGQHSGMASGIVADSFRVARVLLDRLENSTTGEITVGSCNVEVPADRHAEADQLARAVPGAAASFPFAGETRPVADDEVELLLNNTWRPTLSITGASGMPTPDNAGNVLRDETTLALSLRLPPTADSASALAEIKEALTTDVPYSATVELSGIEAADGWNAPTTAPWLATALERVSDDVFGAPSLSAGLGGSIPFMGLLGETYPEAQFLVTGALGPDSNAHVPDEWLHVPYATRVTEAIAHILDAHARG